MVISILAILGTISYVYFQGYVKSSRDSSRVTNLKSVETALKTKLATSGRLPQPDNAASITSSGRLI